MKTITKMKTIKKTNTMKTLKKVSILVLTAMVFTACSSDDDTPIPVNEEEVITTITATLIPSGGGAAITMQSRDLDGDGPNAPVITVSGSLVANTTYNGSLVLLNETEDPAELINTEIEEEDDEHQFFYQATNGIATFNYVDFDVNGKPLGLEFTVVTSDAGSGNITITLRHEPNKDAANVSMGDITNAGGETDIQATFSVMVQ